MPQRLIVLAKPHYSDQKLDWFILKDAEVSQYGQFALCELSYLVEHSPSDVVVVPAVEHVHARKLNAEKIKDRHLKHSIRFIMEPFIGNAIDDNHISHIKLGKSVYGFAIRNEDLAYCEEIAKLFPDADVRIIPMQAGVLQTDFSQGPSKFLGRDFTLESDGQICFQPYVQPSKNPLLVDDLPASDLLQMFKVKGTPCLSLIKKRKASSGWLTWKLAASLMVCLGASSLYSINLEANKYLSASDKIKSDIEDHFTKLFPDEAIVSLNRQVQIKLNDVRNKDEVSQSINAYETLNKLELVAKQARRSSVVSVQFSEDTGTVNFDLASPSLDANSAFTTRLANYGAKVTLNKTSNQDGQFLSSYQWSQKND